MDPKDKLISDAVLVKVKLLADRNEQVDMIEKEIQNMGEVIDKKLSEFQEVLNQKIQEHEEE